MMRSMNTTMRSIDWSSAACVVYVLALVRGIGKENRVFDAFFNSNHVCIRVFYYNLFIER